MKGDGMMVTAEVLGSMRSMSWILLSESIETMVPLFIITHQVIQFLLYILTATTVANWVVTISVPFLTFCGTMIKDGSLLSPIVEAGILVDAFRSMPLAPAEPTRFIVNRMTPSRKDGCTLLISPGVWGCRERDCCIRAGVMSVLGGGMKVVISGTTAEEVAVDPVSAVSARRYWRCWWERGFEEGRSWVRYS